MKSLSLLAGRTVLLMCQSQLQGFLFCFCSTFVNTGIFNPYHAEYVIYYTPHQIFEAFQIQASIVKNSVDPEQPADLDLECFKNRIYKCSAGQGLILRAIYCPASQE